MPIVAQDVKDYAGEFSAVADATITKFIAYAETRINADLWGEQTDLAHILMTAHMMKAAGWGDGNATSTGERGAVTMEKVGDLARSYADPGASSASNDNSNLGRTTYGAEFKELAKTLVITPLAVEPDGNCY